MGTARSLIISGVGCFFLRNWNQSGSGWRLDSLVVADSSLSIISDFDYGALFGLSGFE